MVRTVLVLIAFATLAFTTCDVVARAQEDPIEEPGLEFLDQAMQQKLASRNMKDLDAVVSLGEKALLQGLSPGNEEFAKQLIGSTHYERAERLLQTLNEGRINLAWARRRQIALESIQKAMEFVPEDPEVYLLHARLHELGGGDVDEGLKSATRAFELLSDYPARRCVALMSMAKFTAEADQRLEYLNKAVSDDPNNVQARRSRGQARVLTKDMEGAIQDFQFVLERDNSDVDSLRSIAQILVLQEKFDEALEQINDNIRSRPEESGGYTLRSSIYLVQEKFELAELDLNKALELNPRSITALRERAGLFLRKGDFQEALADATRILELEPGLLSAVLLRSEIAISAGNYSRAISDLRRLLRELPEDVPLRLRLAGVYLADDNPKMAIATYDEILSDDPQEWDAVRGRADALLNTGDHANAIKEYERALSAMPEDDGILNNLAWVLATSTIDDVRDGQRAIVLATKACEITEYQAAHILSTLAAAFAETGDFETATEWSTKAVALGEGEIKEQLSAELRSYQGHQPWRERQTMKSEKGSLAEALQTDLEDQESVNPEQSPKIP